MYEIVTIARPYAQAIFEIAKEQKQIPYWKFMLTVASLVICDNKIHTIISGIISYKKLSDILINSCGNYLNIFFQNLIKIMAENKRIKIFPYILQQFVILCNVQKNIKNVDLISAIPLNDEQLKTISNIMQHILSSNIKLNCKIDYSIIAGIIIRVGNMIINSSIKDRVDRLKHFLQDIKGI